MNSAYVTGNKGMDEKIAKAMKKQPQGKSRLQLLTEAEENDVPENKYGVAPKNERTYNNEVFASKHEMERFIELELLQRGNKIEDLQTQVHFNLMQGFTHPQVGRVNAIEYIADFVYKDMEGEYFGKTVVEDAKGVRTTEYQLKRKLFLKTYPEYIFLEV